MNTKERLYAVIGGCVGAVLTMVVCSVVPIGAQSKADRFGEITCNGIKVVNRNGRTMVELGSGETVVALLESGRTRLRIPAVCLWRLVSMEGI